MKPFYLLFVIFFFCSEVIHAQSSSILAFRTEINQPEQNIISNDTFAFTHHLFGLQIKQTLADIQVYEPAPSPFKQPHSYLLTKLPVPGSSFPIVVATITEKTGLCRVSGSFAIEKESPGAIQMLIQFVMHFSNTLGRPSSTDAGHILWKHIPANTLGIEDVSILTDQLPEDITLITISYDLINQDGCPTSAVPSDETTAKGKDNKDK